MPPKRSSSSSKRGSTGSAKPAAKSASSKAKADAKAKPEASKGQLQQEATETFEKFQPDGDLNAKLTLKEFSNIIRDMNRRKCMLWGQEEECGPIIKQEWAKLDGFQKREITFAEFQAWWPTFVELVQARQEEVETAKAEEAQKVAIAEQALNECCNGDGIWRVPMKSLKFALKKAREKGKTPLIVDNTEGHAAESFFTYTGAYVIECKKLIMEKGASKRPVEDILEDERERFFRGKCFKIGQTVMFRMANTACDLKGTFNSSIFPTLALLDIAELRKVVGRENVSNVEKSPFMAMCPDDQDERLELVANGIHEHFNCVMVTHFQEEDYAEFLEPMVPLELMQPIRPLVE